VIERAAVSKTLSQSMSDVRSFIVPDWLCLPEHGFFQIVNLAFDITDPADRMYVLPCVLNLSPLQVSKQFPNLIHSWLIILLIGLSQRPKVPWSIGGPRHFASQPSFFTFESSQTANPRKCIAAVFTPTSRPA
jgi:hypothetical protein